MVVMMRTVGLLGFGRMGSRIARRLVSGGWNVTVFDPRAGTRMGVEAIGAVWAGDAEALGVVSDVVMTVLPGPTELEEALLGSGSPLSSMRQGTLWLDATSGDPRVTQRLVAHAAVRGVRCVSAPMGGGPRDAEAGSLRFFVAGNRANIESSRDVLDVLSGPDGIAVVGEDPADAQVVKLLANLLWFGQVAAVTEALLLGQSLGLDPVTVRNVLSRSAAAGAFLTDSTDALFSGDYLENFPISRCLEELSTVAALAEQTSTPFDISTAISGLYRDAVDQFGDADGELLVAKLLEQRAGRLLRPSTGV
ncbi:NAD(P)-dependent oxidoreductase [Lacisediminihabitans sp. H27-G8]|uniref:NAD(P)-dependent oxidoreductase n=1 Tax=Lacisediminihabitans sp. H27-G8 TaxID=3111909 RepID=UPI0038FC3CD3